MIRELTGNRPSIPRKYDNERNAIFQAWSSIYYFEMDGLDGNGSVIECPMNNLFTESVFLSFSISYSGKMKEIGQEAIPKIHLHDISI